MGYMRHHAIVVTSWDESRINAAYNRAAEIFGSPYVSSVIKSPLNGCSSFFVPPDGSKEGWPESEVGDARRAEFIAHLHAQAYDDGSNALKWVVPWYGDDERGVGIESDGDEKLRSVGGCVDGTL
ncbi:MAG: hypothetical protein NW202_13295 [Nitrospira sp.]|nr:hypothetical protein [Nitrospira sp.]